MACVFIIDNLNRMWPWLKVPPCYTQQQLNDSLATRCRVFVPAKMLFQFKGDNKAVFRWWLSWVWRVAHNGPGKKIIVLPEVWRHCNPDTIPRDSGNDYNAAALRSLPLGSFIGFNRLSGGRVFYPNPCSWNSVAQATCLCRAATCRSEPWRIEHTRQFVATPPVRRASCPTAQASGLCYPPKMPRLLRSSG